ncbi:SMP-30/gluconolactonase/LRE family protein [bacterium]|nr:SMP-30/gluconolactonase/LRE family protein [bacterium]
MKRNFNVVCMRFVFVVFLISCLPALGQINKNFRENQKNAFAASSIEECQTSLHFCNEVLKVVPNHPIMNYLSARLNAQLGHTDIALEQLKKATELGYTVHLPYYKIHHLSDSAFISLRGKKEFRQIKESMEKPEEQIHKSQLAYTISDKELNPEGITYDPVENIFYLGSLSKQKIVQVNHFGNSTDFTVEGQDGLGDVLGVHVDPVRRYLWACSNKKNKTEIFKYNLLSGKLIKKYVLPPEVKRAFFNDLIIHPNGDIYITDTDGASIYLITHASDKLELFLKDKLFVALNGITLSEDGNTIFAADYLLGIYKVDIKTKSFSLLTHATGFNTLGIDGLYCEGNHFYAVQDILMCQISEFLLNEDATHIESCNVFERNSPFLIAPRTGVIVDDYFYFLGDPEMKGKNREGVIVMKAPLKSID